MTEDGNNPMRRTARKAGVSVAGVATIAVGIVLIPLPGPGSLVILGGIAILGREFPAAHRLANRGKAAIRKVLGSSPNEHDE